ncbi:MAG: ABC transporter ATP-binding protein [Anaerolineaceae bacterium]|nr:ABC transporter ATP-binding protein [Anaerolineaceae bacterium]
MKDEILLNIKNLHTSFQTRHGLIPAVDGVSFNIKKGESVALVGESGSGKSVTALSILKLLAIPPAVIKADEIRYSDTDLLTLPDSKMRQVRGNEISMIFQEPMTSLNPLMTIGFQIGEALETHRHMRRKDTRQVVIDQLTSVGIADAANRVDEYPHQMSGGMRQRVMIAMALSCDPKILIADEPTTALDVTIQAQILDLIASIQKERQMAMLLITHNLGIVAEVAKRVMVMYAGQVVEEAPIEAIFNDSAHPYTSGLLKSIPSVEEKKEVLNVIPGIVPSPLFFPKGCRFHPRCPYARERCLNEVPPMTEFGKERKVRCFYPLAGGSHE